MDDKDDGKEVPEPPKKEPTYHRRKPRAESIEEADEESKQFPNKGTNYKPGAKKDMQKDDIGQAGDKNWFKHMFGKVAAQKKAAQEAAKKA